MSQIHKTGGVPVSADNPNAVYDVDRVHEKSGSGSDSGSVSQWYGAADAVPCQNFTGSTTPVVPVCADNRNADNDDYKSPRKIWIRIRFRIRKSVLRSRGSGSVQKCHGPLVVPVSADHRNAVHDDDRVHAVRLLRLHLHDVRHQLLNTT